MARTKQWVQVAHAPRPNDPLQKADIVAACEAFIRDRLKPRFLPEIRPTEFNYPIDIRGAWAGGRYRFLQRYRAGGENPSVAEFDAPFARIDHMGAGHFDVFWMRHTGQWLPLHHKGLTLAAALRTLETDEVLFPN